MPLSIDKHMDADSSELTATLSGRLDTLTSPQLDEMLTENLDGVKSLVFDMADLTYISSAGLRILLKYQMEMKKQGKMSIRNIRKEVMTVLKLTGFDKFLKIEQ